MVDYCADNKLVCVDFLKKYSEDFARYKLQVNDYLDLQFIGRAGAQVFGHYNPYGNFFFANAMRQDFADWLNPKPPSYQGQLGAAPLR